MRFLKRLFTGRYKSILETTNERKKSDAFRWASKHYQQSREIDIAARFALILEYQLNVPLNTFAKTTSFLDDLAMDEMEPVEVAMALEEEFRISKIEEHDAEKMEIFDDVVRYLLSLNEADGSEQSTGGNAS